MSRAVVLKSMKVKFVPWRAWSPIIVRLDGASKVKLDSLLVKLKEPSPIDVTPAGRLKEVKLVPLKAWSPITVRLEGASKVKLDRLLAK